MRVSFSLVRTGDRKPLFPPLPHRRLSAFPAALAVGVSPHGNTVDTLGSPYPRRDDLAQRLSGFLLVAKEK